jgi:hypothetical protein
MNQFKGNLTKESSITRLVKSLLSLQIVSPTHSLSHLLVSQFISISVIYYIRSNDLSMVYLRQHFLDHRPRIVVDETSETKALKPLKT